MGKRSAVLLTEQEVNRLLESASVNPGEHLVLRLLVKSGFLPGELYGIYDKKRGEWVHGLQKKDISNKSLWVYQVKRKNNNIKREVSLTDQVTLELLRDFTKTMTSETYVFRDTMSYYKFEQLPRKYGQHAGLEKRVSPRSLRYYFIMDLLRKGMDIPAIQYRAGHRDVETTLRYVQ
jgi:site-specific recombinase XerD